MKQEKTFICSKGIQNWDGWNGLAMFGKVLFKFID